MTDPVDSQPTEVDMPTPVVERSSIDDLIAQFHAFEIEEELFERCKTPSGLPWWDLVRYSVQFALAIEWGLYGNAEAHKRGLAARLSGFVRDCYGAAVDAVRLQTISGAKFDNLFVFSRSVGSLLDDLARNEGKSLVIAPRDIRPPARAFVEKRSVELLIALRARFMRLPGEVRAEIDQIAASLRSEFSSDIDFADIMVSKYRTNIAAQHVWSRILQRLQGVSNVGFVNDDTLRSLVFLANGLGATTREYQHGYAGRSHIAYSYPVLDVPPSTLPKQLVVSRDTGDITLPVELIFTEPGRKHDMAGRESDVGERDIDVLIGGSPTRNEMAHYLAAGLVGKGLSVAIKLHPAQTVTASGFRAAYNDSELIIFDGKADFVPLARRTKVYLPANPTSTTVYEAVEQGAAVAVVDYEGRKVTSAIDKLVAVRDSSIERLLPALQRLLSGKDGAT